MMKSIQSKLVILMLGMLSVVLLVNLYVFIQSMAMMHRIDRVFVSNVSMVELTDILDSVQSSVYEYLNTRSSASVENFYRYEQNYRDLYAELNDRIVDNSALMLEKNIRFMSESYLEAAGEAVQAKRGRNVEEYRSAYQSARKLYDYINAYIYELNTLRFAQNSEEYQNLMRVTSSIERSSLMLILAAFAASLTLSTMIIRQMIGPLKDLAGAANSVAEGNLDVEVPSVRSRDEVGVVTDAFSRMLESIREYIEDQRVSLETEARMKENELSMQAHLKEAQLKYLQAQINPHFLFNSLNAGSQLAVLEGADRTEEFLARMADFFRYNVRKTEGDASLKEEINSVENYIYVLNVRFAGDIHYTEEIAEDIDPETVRMPSMILQPIVENAIQHGIHDMHGDGKVTLYVEGVSAEDNETGRSCVRITVADNGTGMTGTQIRAIMQKAGSGGTRREDEAVPSDGGEDHQSAGIALANVISRLELYYSEDDLFSIWSDGPGCGTEVTVLLPVGEKEEAEETEETEETVCTGF